MIEPNVLAQLKETLPEEVFEQFKTELQSSQKRLLLIWLWRVFLMFVLPWHWKFIPDFLRPWRDHRRSRQ